MEELQLAAESRETKGSSTSRSMRREGWLPGVIYRGGKAPRHIRLKERDFVTAIRRHAGENVLVNIQVGQDQPLKTIMREVQHHPVNGSILHVDFYEVDMSQRLRVDVTLNLTGTPFGVSQQGGVLEHLLHSVEIECLPGDLVEHFDVDVSELKIGDRLTVEDIKIDAEKYELVTGMDIAIAAVSAPRVEQEPTEGEEGAAAEPEVIREKKPEADEA